MHSHSPKVLVVDDEPHIVTAIQYLLEKQGCLVTTAFNGTDALSKMTITQPDVIVLDVMMPDMDGYEVATRMYQMDLCPDARIIFLTAKGAERDRQKGFASGGEYYMTKPFDNQILVSTVIELVAYG